MGDLAGPKPVTGVPPVPEGLRQPRGALQLYLQVKEFAEDCVANGDMTPAAERMLLKIITDWGKPERQQPSFDPAWDKSPEEIARIQALPNPSRLT